MNYPPDPRLLKAKEMPITDVIKRLKIAGLRPAGVELVGPCPLCGGRGRKSDRFAINLRSNLFQCRQCGIRGGDQVKLVQEIMNLTFLESLELLCGDREAHIDPVEMERRLKKAAAEQEKQDAYAAKARKKARNDAERIWGRGEPAACCPEIKAYLERRGITPDLLPIPPKTLRFIPSHPYVKKVGREYVTFHTGPCMIALIQGMDDRGAAVHQTWIDLDRPNGKALIEHDGEKYSSKLVRGSKKGGAIRLSSYQDQDTLVMAEGIENTLTAMVARPFESASYWAGVDLGNMAGVMQKIKGTRYSGLPLMSDAAAFVPPEWVRRLVFIMDGDSEPKMTRAKLESGIQRAMALRPGLTGQIVDVPRGVDLNDILMNQTANENGGDDERSD